MASLSPLQPRTTSSASNSNTTTTITACPIFLHNNASKFSFMIRKRNHGITSRKITCSGGDQNHKTSSSKNYGQPSIGKKLDRRDILVGIGGLYGVAGLGANDLIALANPILFYDEDAQPVSIKKVKDCLNNIDPRYKYEEVSSSIDPWLNARPTPLKKANKVSLLKTVPMKRTELSEYPITLNKVIHTEVPRPKKSRSKTEKTEVEEVLVIDGIELESDLFVKFDVLVNDEDAVARPDNTEFAGSFVNVPHKHKQGRMNKTRLRIGLTALLEDLEADDDDTVLVTLVPRSGTEDVTVGGIKIELSS